MTIPQFELLMEEKKRNEDLLAKTNEALMTYTNELKKFKKMLVSAVTSANPNVSQNNTEDQNIENCIQRLVKYKEENKKLKVILK